MSPLNNLRCGTKPFSSSSRRALLNRKQLSELADRERSARLGVEDALLAGARVRRVPLAYRP